MSAIRCSESWRASDESVSNLCPNFLPDWFWPALLFAFLLNVVVNQQTFMDLAALFKSVLTWPEDTLKTEFNLLTIKANKVIFSNCKTLGLNVKSDIQIAD